MPSQHKVTPLSIRLPEAERLAAEESAGREGIAVRAWILAAIREKLARDQQPSLTQKAPGI
jgi:hypothetical protein